MLTPSTDLSSSSGQYLTLNVKVEALARLLSSHALHADELRCANHEGKRLISAMLISAASSAR